MSTLTGPLPESSVRASNSSDPVQAFKLTRQDFSRATVTDAVVEPMAEHTVDPTMAAVAALQDLVRGVSPTEGVNLTTEPDSISLIGEKTQISQLRVLRTIFIRMLRKSSKGCSTLQCETLELLPYTIDGIIEYLNQQVKVQEEMQVELRRLETTVIWFESSNQGLRINNERLKEELNAVIGIPDEDTESDTEAARSKKRSRKGVTAASTISERFRNNIT